MKHIKYLFIMILVGMLYSSCSSDDDSIDPLVGTWERIVINGPEGVVLKVAFTFNADDSGIYRTDLNLDGEMEIGIEDFSWSTTGETVTISSDGTVAVIYNYSINGNELTFINDPEPNLIFTKQ